MIFLLDEEEIRKFPENETIVLGQFAEETVLKHKSNGDCIYLDAHGCTVHEDKPILCKVFDCRKLASMNTWTEARKSKVIDIRVWRKGRDLLKHK